VVYTTGASVLGAGTVDEFSATDPHPVSAVRPRSSGGARAGGWVIRPAWCTARAPAWYQLIAGWAARRGTGVYIGRRGAVAGGARRGPRGPVRGSGGGTADRPRLARGGGDGAAGRDRGGAGWRDGGLLAVADAEAELGPLADLFTRDQEVSSAHTRRTLGWSPAHTAMLTEIARG